METGQIKINGDAITVIFTGKKYYFHSNYCGIVGIATRESKIDDLRERKYAKFSLIAGYKNVYRYKYVTAMKRYIKKSENKYVDCDVEYVDSGKVCNHYLDIEDHEYSI